MLQWLRIKTVMPYIRGRLLDIGCGNNKLVEEYGNGAGIDKDDKMIIGLFDTITFIASLNYMSIGERHNCATTNYLPLRDDGQIIITCRKVWGGLSKNYIEKLFGGYQLTYYRPFMFGLNGLYIFKRQI